MGRPTAQQEQGRIDPKWRYVILDGYVDEPSSLGVPPYISPQVRSLAGGLICGGAGEDEVGYLTVDQWRKMRGAGNVFGKARKLEAIFIMYGCIVPGRYLRGTPISRREIGEASREAGEAQVIATGIASGSLDIEGVEVSAGDPGVLGEGVASSGTASDRDRTADEWNDHLLAGAFVIWMHPDHPSPLIAEIETSRGCPRYVSGGCSFCSEPGKGPVQFREPANIAEEVRKLADLGLENIRIGGQSDLLTYMSPQVGRSEVPEPDPAVLGEMMQGAFFAVRGGKGVRRAAAKGRRTGIDTGIVHTDNANAAVISEHPELSREALIRIVEHTTPGTVLALGLESADPEVRRLNNLNSGPGEIIDAVRMMNEVGGERGENGLPRLLPGINFLGGLPGQVPESFSYDIDLLESILKEDLLVRRTNIRGALFPGRSGVPEALYLKGKLRKAFVKFKEKVRSELDPIFLERIVGRGGVLKGVYTEAVSGHVTFGRQIGSYPVLVGIEHGVPLGSFIDVAVNEFSGRSVTGFRTPFPINRMSFRDLQGLPGVGKKRAASIFNAIPLEEEDLKMFLDNEPWVIDHIELS
ncbi:MAG: radical SAM protein [Thermoplasmatota archaeon]